MQKEHIVVRTAAGRAVAMNRNELCHIDAAS